jgi:hypothetical protein
MRRALIPAFPAPPAGERLAEFLRSCGLTLAEYHTLGEETEGRRAWGGFAVTVVQ